MTKELQSLYNEISEMAARRFPGSGEHLVLGDGPDESPKVLLLGEAPGAHEVEEGRPFVGQAGKNLNEFLTLNVSDEFRSMFDVVIQLGAILAVVVLFFRKLNPFAHQIDFLKTERKVNASSANLIGRMRVAPEQATLPSTELSTTAVIVSP